MPDADDVLAANAAFYAAFNARDPARMAALWSRGEALTCIHPNWNILSGREAVLESWTSILGNPQQPRVVSGAATALVFGDVAIVIGRELVSGLPLAATNVFVREGGPWRLVHHHASPVALTTPPG